MNSKKLEIINRAIDVNGIDNQIEMVVEECSELILAIQKLKRAKFSIYRGNIPIGTSTKNNLIYAALCSEVADVKIMIAQMEIMLNKEMIDMSVDRKLTRLEKRLDDKVK